MERKERQSNPTAPYITSKLQQDASGRLGFNVRRTMGVAQRLYEGVEIGGRNGRPDHLHAYGFDARFGGVDCGREGPSCRSAGRAVSAEEAIDYKGKKDAQDAHEAIRPTHVEFTPDSIKQYLSDEQYRLYKLIWQKFVSSQMAPAVFDQTTIEIAAKADRTYDFRISGSILKFEGFLAVWENASEDAILPDVQAGDALDVARLTRSRSLRNRRRASTRRRW